MFIINFINFATFADDGAGSSSRPTPQPRGNIAPQVSLLDEPVPPLLTASGADPTPALLPLIQDGLTSTTQDEVLVVIEEDTPTPQPVKPERKKRKGPPPVPAPYAGPLKVASEVSFEREREREREREKEREGGGGGGGMGRGGGRERCGEIAGKKGKVQ